MEDNIRIEVPRVHPSINEWKNWHWTKYRAEKLQWAHDVGWLLKPCRHIKIEGRVKVFIWYCFTDNQRRDKDNYAPKFILDPIRDSGITGDDNSREMDVDWDFRFNCPKAVTIIKISKAVQNE